MKHSRSTSPPDRDHGVGAHHSTAQGAPVGDDVSANPSPSTRAVDSSSALLDSTWQLLSQLSLPGLGGPPHLCRYAFWTALSALRIAEYAEHARCRGTTIEHRTFRWAAWKLVQGAEQIAAVCAPAPIELLATYALTLRCAPRRVERSNPTVVLAALAEVVDCLCEQLAGLPGDEMPLDLYATVRNAVVYRLRPAQTTLRSLTRDDLEIFPSDVLLEVVFGDKSIARPIVRDVVALHGVVA